MQEEFELKAESKLMAPEKWARLSVGLLIHQARRADLALPHARPHPRKLSCRAAKLCHAYVYRAQRHLPWASSGQRTARLGGPP